MASLNSKIALVGFSWRLPGGSGSGSGVWSDLTTGKNLVTSVPEDRWALDAFSHPSKSAPGTAYTTAAGTLGKIDGFDAAFFGISPREAEQLDPQQRLLLEMAWEAFESGGIQIGRAHV